MKNTLLCRLFLLVLCCFLGIGYDVHAMCDVRASFAALWNDTSRKDIALSCIRECISEESKVLNVTKHLIGHGHVLDVSEVAGKLPASFLFINSGDQVHFLKFLRELYNIVNDGANGHPKGALYVLETADFTHKSTALTEMQRIFSYGRNSPLQAKSQSVFDKILELMPIMELNQRIISGKNAAETLYRQLSANKVSAGLTNSLAFRIPKEIELYRQAGVDVTNLIEMVYTDDVIDDNKMMQLKANVQPLAEAVFVIKEGIPPPQDIVAHVEGIKTLITNLFFKESERTVLDNLIVRFFNHFTHQYLQAFLAIIEGGDVKIENDISKISIKSNVGISFEKRFTGEDFKRFVLSSLGTTLEIASPDKTTNVILSLRSNLNKPPLDTEPRITVSADTYGVLSTYLATFFPLSQ